MSIIPGVYLATLQSQAFVHTVCFHGDSLNEAKDGALEIFGKDKDGTLILIRQEVGGKVLATATKNNGVWRWRRRWL